MDISSTARQAFKKINQSINASQQLNQHMNIYELVSK